MRVILFTGKGGVGKTTTAAATALRIAAAGQRVVVTSADPAHSLADSFGIELASEPTEVAPGCWAQQLDGRERLEENWADIRDWMMEVFEWAGVDEIAAEELAMLPGLEEVFALTEVESLCESGDFDVVVVDCAPTAETVRLLSLPDILSWYMDRLYPASRRMNRMVGPIVSRITSLPVASDSVFVAGRRFYDRIDAVREILSDPEVTSVRLVVNPEAMVVAEARRTYTYLALFGYHIDAVVVNRVLPESVEGEWMARWRSSQQVHLDTIADCFGELPILMAEHTGAEVVGMEQLGEFGGSLWGEVNPSDRLHEGRPMRMAKEGESVVLSIGLPFTESSDIELSRTGDDLFVAVGPHRRSLALPESLRRRDVDSAKVADGSLRIRFVDRAVLAT
ncbi:MAG TPA: ArsA family ATPase [Microthrixaceae bacterium]|nr:ArsA family ATPase [Microthrixaceae bacterium]